MAKIFIADKETLDNVSTNVGKTTDTGGTTTGGSLFSKLNALLTSWTGARAAKIDTIATDAASAVANSTLAKEYAYQASVSSANAAGDADVAEKRTVEILNTTKTDNNPIATGILSQKLSYIIERLGSMGGQKVLIRQDLGVIPCTPTIDAWSYGTINLVGPGVVHAVYCNSFFDFTKNIGVTIDGVRYELGRVSNSSERYIVQYVDGTIGYTSSPSSAAPIRFKQSFVVDVLTNGAGNTMPTFRVNFERYESI